MSEIIRDSYLSSTDTPVFSRAASDKDSSMGGAFSCSESADLLRCFSVLVDSVPPSSSGGSGKNAASQKLPTMPMCQRMTSMQTYMSMNRYNLNTAQYFEPNNHHCMVVYEIIMTVKYLVIGSCLI
jgi:hypothetical protein